MYTVHYGPKLLKLIPIAKAKSLEWPLNNNKFFTQPNSYAAKMFLKEKLHFVGCVPTSLGIQPTKNVAVKMCTM